MRDDEQEGAVVVVDQHRPGRIGLDPHRQHRAVARSVAKQRLGGDCFDDRTSARREAQRVGDPFVLRKASVPGAREAVAPAARQEVDRVRSVHDAQPIDVLVHHRQLRREVGGRG